MCSSDLGRGRIAPGWVSDLVAFDPEHGTPLWHARLHGVSNAPETYMLDDHQYVVVAAGDTLYAFTLY